MKLEYCPAPFAHIRARELVPPEIYATMRFPDLQAREMGRIGYDLYRGEPGWDAVISQPGWKEFYAEVSSREFVARIFDLFRDDLIANKCGFDIDNWTLKEFDETRAEVKTAYLEGDADPGEIFTRFDFQSIDETYRAYAHLDWPRRIVGGVLFMSSAEEEKMVGGEFALFRDADFRNDRRMHKPVLAAQYPVEHNTGYFFLNSNAGFHGPTPMRQCIGMRKWIYYSISSRRDVWFADPA